MALVQKTSNLSFPSAKSLKGTRGLHMIVYAMPGVGKTTLAATAQEHPEGADVLIIDPEQTTGLVLGDRDDIAVFVPDNYAHMLSELDKLVKGYGKTHPYKTIVFDTITAVYYKMIIPAIVGGVENQVSQPQYGQANRKLIKLIDDMRHFTETGAHIIFNGHTKEERDGDVINIRLGLTPQMQENVHQSFDHILYYELKRGVRTLYMESQSRFEAKFRQPRSGVQMPSKLTEPSFGAIFDHWKKI